MQELANEALGVVPVGTTADRELGSVQVSSGATLIDVLWHGQAAHLYYTPQATGDEWFGDVLNRLRSRGFTIVEPATDGRDAWIEVTPDRTMVDIAEDQDAMAW